MEVNQIAKMIEWLDEERRNDKKVIATLEERLQQQQETISTLQRRVNSVESDQSIMRGTSNGIGSSELLEQTRNEMRQLLETSEARRLAAEREADRRVEISREQMQRNLREMQDQLERVQRSTGMVSEVKTEGTRVADNVSVLSQRIEDVSKRLEEPERRLTFLEEQRRQDARRISEIESELPEVKKQIDTLRPKVSLIEDLSIRNERRIQETQNSERERREQIQQFLDQQSLLAQQRDQKVDDILKRFAQHDQAMQENIERFETWAAAYRDMKRIIDDFERIGERLERRINEVAEMQRLSEERFRQEWNDWADDDQKRWKQLRLSSDEVWRNHDKEFEQFTKRVEALQNTFDPLADSLKRLWNLERERAAMYRDRYQSLILQYDTNTAPQTNPTSSETGTNGTGLTRNGSY